MDDIENWFNEWCEKIYSYRCQNNIDVCHNEQHFDFIPLWYMDAYDNNQNIDLNHSEIFEQYSMNNNIKRI